MAGELPLFAGFALLEDPGFLALHIMVRIVQVAKRGQCHRAKTVRCVNLVPFYGVFSQGDANVGCNSVCPAITPFVINGMLRRLRPLIEGPVTQRFHTTACPGALCTLLGPYYAPRSGLFWHEKHIFHLAGKAPSCGNLSVMA